MKKKVYEVVIGSPPEYDELVAYLYYGESLKDALEDEESNEEIINLDRYEIAILTKEEGPDKIKIRFSEYATKNDLNIDELLKVIKNAKEELLK